MLKINLSNLTTYVLYCPKYPERWTNIQNMCAKLGISPIQIISEKQNYSHQKNIAFGSINLMNLAIANDSYPFLIFEDDATLIDNIPPIFEIPSCADMIYWGATKSSGPPIVKNRIRLENYNTNYYRIINSQSTHAIIIPNKNSALWLKDIYTISFDTNIFHDVILANVSENRMFLTPKDAPYFYQNDGHSNRITKFKWNQYPGMLQTI